MRYRLSAEEMELLAMHRAKLDAELDGILNVIDKIIDSTEVEY